MIDPTNPSGLPLINLSNDELDFVITRREEEVFKAREDLERALQVRRERELDSLSRVRPVL